MRSACVCEGGRESEAMVWATRQRQCVGAGAERSGAGEMAWVTESDPGRGASGSVRGSGYRGRKGSVRLSVHWNGDGSATAVMGVSAGTATTASAVAAEQAVVSRGSGRGATIAGVAACGRVQGGVGGQGGVSEGGGHVFSSGLGDLKGRNGNKGSKRRNQKLT